MTVITAKFGETSGRRMDASPPRDLFGELSCPARTGQTARAESRAEANLRKVLMPDAFETVSDTVRRWNAPLREAVRTVTALRFTDDTGRTMATAPVTVVDGMPKLLADAAEDIEPWQWWIVLNRPALIQASAGLGLILGNRAMFAPFLGDDSTRIDAVARSRALISSILHRSVERELLTRFQKIEEDVMGAYWIKQSKIQIYWMPLAIFAPLFGVSLSTLTAVVLCHELVHAYTHRGIDLNQASWPTAHFARTDRYVAEGLAQFYTEQIMRSLATRLPDGLETFLAKTSRQSNPYTAYQHWLGENRQPSLEAVRLAMLQFRNISPAVFDHASFLGILRLAEAQIRGRQGESNG